MASKGSNLFVSLGLRGLEKFDNDLKSAERSLARTGRNFKSIGKDFSLAFTAPLVGIGTIAFKAALDFERAFQPVATLVGDNVKRLDELRKGVLDLSVATGKGATDIASSLGLTMEKFGDVADLMERVAIITKLAKIAQVDYALALDYSHDMADAYDDESLKMLSTMADNAAMARRLNVSFTEYAKGMGTCAAFASVLGIEQGELAAQYITLVKATGDAGLASSQLKMIYSQLIKPSTELRKMMARMGAPEGGRQLIAMKGFLGALELLKKESADTGKEMDSMFKRAGSIVAIEKFLGKAKEFQETLKALGGDAGEVDRQFSGLSKDLSGAVMAWDKFKAEINRVRITLGDELLRILPDVVAGLKPIVDQTYKIIRAFGELDPQTKKNIIGFLGTVAAIGPVILYFGLLANSIRAIIGIGRGLIRIPAVILLIRGAMAALSAHPIILITMALYELFNWLYRWRDTWKEMFAPMGSALASAYKEVKSWFTKTQDDYTGWRGAFEDTVKGLPLIAKTEVARINEELGKIQFMQPGGVATGKRLGLPVGKIGPTPTWKPEGLLDKVIRDKLLAEYDASMKKIAADTRVASAAVEASMTGTQRVVRDAIGEIEARVARLGPTIMRMNEAIAASGGKLTFPVVGVLRNFALIDEQMKRLKETVEVLNVVSPETAKVVDEEFKKISASLEAVRPYAERLNANFEKVQQTITAEMTLACNNIKRNLASLPTDMKLVIDLDVSPKKLFKPGELGKAPGYKINLGDLKEQTEEAVGFFAAMRIAVDTTVKEMGKGFGNRLDDMKYMVRQWGDDFTTAIQDALRTGNWDFAKFVDLVMADITRLLLYTYVTTPLFQAFKALINAIAPSAAPEAADVGVRVGSTGSSSLGKNDLVMLGNRLAASFESIQPTTIVDIGKPLQKGDLGKTEMLLSAVVEETKRGTRVGVAHGNVAMAAPKVSLAVKIPPAPKALPVAKIPEMKDTTPTIGKMFTALWGSMRGSIAKVTPKVSVAVKVPVAPIPLLSIKMPAMPKTSIALKIPAVKDSTPAIGKIFSSVVGSIGKLTTSIKAAMPKPAAIQRAVVALKSPIPRVVTESGVSPAFRMAAAFATGTARLSRDLRKDNQIGTLRGGLALAPRPQFARSDSRVNVTVIDQRRADSAPIKTTVKQSGLGKQITVLVQDTVRSGLNAGTYDGDLRRNFNLPRWGTR